jgi:hypothetical protein
VACTTSVKSPSPCSPKACLAIVRPRSASEPGTLKRLVSSDPRLLVAATPSTNTTIHPPMTRLR